MADQIGQATFWTWESYKQGSGATHRRASRFLSGVRWAVFVAPALALTTVGLWQTTGQQPGFRIAGAIVGVASLAAILVAARLSEEKLGKVDVISLSDACDG